MGKKLKGSAIFAGLLALGLSLLGCSGDVGSSGPDVEPGTIGAVDPALIEASELAKTVDPSNSKVLLFYSRPDTSYSDWGVWLWTGTGDGEPGYDATKGKVIKNGSLGYWDITDCSSSLTDIQNAISENDKLGIIIRNASWAKDPGIDQILDLSVNKHFLVISGDSTVYEVTDSITPTISGAVATSSTAIKVNLSVSYGLDVSTGNSGFVVVDSDGTEVVVSDAINYENQTDRNRNNARIVLLRTATPLDTGKTYFVKNEKFKPAGGCSVVMMGAVKESATYNGDDLGLTLDGQKAIFKTWAPMASSVNVLLYSNVGDIGNFGEDAIKAKAVGETTSSSLKGSPSEILSATKNPETNVWTAEINDISSYHFYKYEIINAGETYYVSDIWGKSCTADAIASGIVDINSAPEAIPTSISHSDYGSPSGYYNPFNGSRNSDAVVYEMHITDWSYAEDDITKNVGKYETISNGTKVINHIKSMGVTHVQILPVFEFAETNDNTDYNWGYNPYHYNVPEGRYATSGYTDATTPVKELRKLIGTFHDNGIAVIMDVVYNHTSGTGKGSLYDSTVPYYFYRLDASGAYSNGSGCGNEVDSEAPMVKKYIIDSLKHWMLDYHVNGFRFDLMGVLSKETMKEIYDELYKIDPKVMVYGEPWTGGTALVVNGANQAVNSNPYGAGAFDDDFRDAVKGAEFGGFQMGQVQGTFKDNEIIAGLTGKTGKNKRNETGKPSLAMHYVECHDNYTLFDKLAISYWMKKNNKTTVTSGDLFTKIGTDGVAEVAKQDTLSAAYIFLSQGTAFINGGQEFLRSKRGDENSYKSPIGKNGIDLNFANTYSDVCNTYKGLIALRQTNLNAFGSGNSATATTVSTGVTKYTTGDFCVYFNATDKSVEIESTGYTKVINVTSGTPTESTTLPANVPAKSFVILKK